MSAKFSDKKAASVELAGIQPVAKSDPAVVDMILSYISKNKLIIYGGIAIDMYLRYHGNSGIYGDEEAPDIDVYTPNIARDMYTITNMVHDLGTHKFVETIPSRTHAHSRRIRYEFGPGVIDLTPIGTDTFKSLPTFTTEFRGHRVRFIDLPVIKMNLYFAMSINPLTNVFRLKKDHSRLVSIKTAKTKTKGSSRGGKSAAPEIDAVTGFHLLDSTFKTAAHPIVIFSSDPYSVSAKIHVANNKGKTTQESKYVEFAPFMDFPGYLSGRTETGAIVDIYFYPESGYILMPKSAYGLLYFFHVKLLECVVTGAGSTRRELYDEYIRAINYVENGNYTTKTCAVSVSRTDKRGIDSGCVDVSTLQIPPNPMRQIITSKQPVFDRIYRPEKKRKDTYDTVIITGISGEKLN